MSSHVATNALERKFIHHTDTMNTKIVKLKNKN